MDSGPVPSPLDSSSTLVGSSGPQAAQKNTWPAIDLHRRALMDIHRANWEVQWGLVEQLNAGDWVLVKWVTSRQPVFIAPEILVLAEDILNGRHEEFPNEPNDEALLMRILEKIVDEYGMMKGSSRIMNTLIEFNIGDRLHNIRQRMNTLDDGVPLGWLTLDFMDDEDSD